MSVCANLISRIVTRKWVAYQTVFFLAVPINRFCKRQLNDAPAENMDSADTSILRSGNVGCSLNFSPMRYGPRVKSAPSPMQSEDEERSSESTILWSREPQWGAVRIRSRPRTILPRGQCH
jgi:hypothetical protein